jgi:hypothetical protein
MKLKIFKVEAQGDVLYIQAEHQADALCKLEEAMGPIPSHLVTWSEVAKLPANEEFL